MYYFRRFETIHAGHADVKQDHGELRMKNLAQRLFSALRRNYFIAILVLGPVQQGFQGKQARRMVVYEKNIWNRHSFIFYPWCASENMVKALRLYPQYFTNAL